MVVTRSRSSGAPTAKPRSDAYTGLLVISLLAQMAGAAFLYLDLKEYPDSKPPAVVDRPKLPAGGVAAPQPNAPTSAPPAGAQGVPPAPPK
jgi:hypothetical protein